MKLSNHFRMFVVITAQGLIRILEFSHFSQAVGTLFRLPNNAYDVSIRVLSTGVGGGGGERNYRMPNKRSTK